MKVERGRDVGQRICKAHERGMYSECAEVRLKEKKKKRRRGEGQVGGGREGEGGREQSEEGHAREW